jgi:ADP-ribose pyrophosphatase YjhB (NUDIX family)
MKILPPGAGTITFHTQTGKVLMIKQETYPGSGRFVWAFPKGHIEKGEHPKKTAERETLEETGINPIILRGLGPVEIYRKTKNDIIKRTIYWFVSETSDTRVRPQKNEGIQIAKFVTLDKCLAYLDQHEKELIPVTLKAFLIFSRRHKDDIYRS